MSRYLTNQDIVTITQYLSQPRLQTFLDLTRTKSAEDAIELHQATMSLGISIMAVTGLIEVALRNAACREIEKALGSPGWLRNPPPSLKWAGSEKNSIEKAEKQARRAVYSKLTGSQKNAIDAQAFPQGRPLGLNHRKVAERRQKTIQVSDGQVVAQLSLNFWKRLFSENYEKTLWKRGLRKTFPDKSLDRSDVAEQLEVIYEVRNRLAHHEPVYGRRLDDSLKSIDFVSHRLDSVSLNKENPFSKLILPQRDILSGQVAIFQATFDRLT